MSFWPRTFGLKSFPYHCKFALAKSVPMNWHSFNTVTEEPNNLSDSAD